MDTVGLADSHLHLTDYEPGADLAAIVHESEEAGVTHLVCNGTCEDDWPKVLFLAGEHSSVLPCVGLHPWFVGDRSGKWLATLEQLVRDSRCGVGEIGLDKCAEPLDREGQEEAFRAQLAIACEYERPAMVHCVRSWGWLMDVLRNEPRLPRAMLIHAYGGSVDMIKPLASLGAYFSFSGKVLFENYERARAAVRVVPRDRLLVETDAPNMMPPVEYQRRVVVGASGAEMNHPANLPDILIGIADLLGESPDRLRERVWANSMEFLKSII